MVRGPSPLIHRTNVQQHQSALNAPNAVLQRCLVLLDIGPVERRLGPPSTPFTSAVCAVMVAVMDGRRLHDGGLTSILIDYYTMHTISGRIRL